MKHLLYILILTYITGCAQIKSNKKMKNNAPKIQLTESEWKEKLTPQQYFILRQKGTERPGTGKFLFHKEKGIYKCAGCGNELFTDAMKFDSHCGWPSFDREIKGGKIKQITDTSHGMRRTEIICAKCDGHLGHIFNDGPTETGQRYCVNSLSLSFESNKSKAMQNTKEVITLGAGCFWCVEAIFDELEGVVSVESGYSGGKVKNPTYKEICTGTTGHAEVINVVYNPTKISLVSLLEVFFATHNPTTLNKQGADVGTQYRSVIFYHNEAQKQQAEEIIDTLNKNKVFPNPIVTEVTAFDKFYKAEDYHQEYYQLNKTQPYCKAVIKPKLDKFYKTYKKLIQK